MMQDSKEVMQSKIEAFNKKHPIGSKVIVVKDMGEQVECTVKHPATILGGHTAVALLDEISGCYDLNRVQ